MASQDADFQIKVTGDSADAQASLDALAKKAEQFGDESVTAGGKAADGLKKANDGAGALDATLGELKTAALGIFATSELANYGEALVKLSDNYTTLQTNLKQATSSQAEYEAALAAVKAIAQSTSQPIDAVGDAYVRIANAGKTLNLTQQQTIDLTQALVEAFDLNGVSAAQAKPQIEAFAKALSQGQIDAGAFSKVIAGTPQLADALAKSLGVTQAQLLDLAKAGKLSGETIVNGMLAAKQGIDELSKARPDTIAQAMTRLTNSFETFIGESGKVGSGSAVLRDTLDGISNNLDTLANVAAVAGVVALSKLAQAAGAKVQAFLAAEAAARAEAAAVTENAQAAAAAALAAQDEAAALTVLARVKYESAAAAQAQAQAAQAAAKAELEQAQAAEASAVAFASAAISVGNEAEAVTALEIAQTNSARAQTALNAAQKDAALTTSVYASATAELVVAQNAEAAASAKAAAANDVLAVSQAKAAGIVATTVASVKDLFGSLNKALNSATLLFAAFEAGQAAGTSLAKNFETVRLAGVALAEGAVKMGLYLKAAFDDAASGWTQHRQIYDELNVKLQKVSDNFQLGFAAATDAGQAAEKAAEKATAGAAKTAAAQKPVLTGLDLLLDKYQLITNKTGQAADSNDDLIKKLQGLSAIKLNQLAAEIGDAFTAGTIDAAQFSQTLADIREVQLQKLGVDTDAVAGRIHAAMSDAILIVKGLGDEAGTSAAQMTAAFDGALAKATTKEDAQALIAAVGEVKIAGFDAAAAVQSIKDRTDELPSAAEKISPLIDAYKTLGIQSASALQESAAQAQNAFKALQDAAAPVGVLDQAFTAMADKALKAAAAQGDTALAIEAAALKGQAADNAQSTALDDLIKKYPALASAATQTGKAQVEAANAANAALVALQKQLEASGDSSDLQDVRNHLREAFDAGKIGADDYTASLAAADEKEQQLANDAQGMGAAIAAGIAQARAHFEAVSEAAAEAYDAVEESASKRNGLIDGFIRDLNDGFYKIDASIKQQQQSVDDLMSAYDNGNISLARFVTSAQSAASGMQYLDKQRLDQLTSAIANARAEMQQLEDAGKSTIATLQDQLDQLNGDQDAIQNRQLAAQRAQIEAQLADAKTKGDNAAVTEFQNALTLQGQIESATRAQQTAAKKQAEADAQQAQQQAQQTQQSQQQHTYTVNLNIGGQTYAVDVADQNSANALLDALQHAQRVSA